MKEFSFTHQIERSEIEYAVEVVYTCSPYIAATYWQPAEGGEIEVVSVTHACAPFALTDAEEEALIQTCAARADMDKEYELSRDEDYRRDQLRDNGWPV